VANDDILLKVGFDDEALNAEINKLKEKLKTSLKDIGLTDLGSQFSDLSRNAGFVFNGGEVVSELGDRLSALRTKLNDTRNSLRASGLSEKEVNSQTKELTSSLRGLENQYTKLKIEQSTSTSFTGAQEKAYIRLGVGVAGAEQSLENFNKENAITSATQARTSKFLESFTFQAGVLGFALIRTGRVLQQFGSSMFTFIKNTNQATQAVKVFRDAFENNDFTQGQLNELRKTFKSVDEALNEAFGTNNIDLIKQQGISVQQILKSLRQNLSENDKLLLQSAESWETLELSIRRAKNTLTELFLPGLVTLNNLVKDKVIPIVESLVNSFNKLSPSMQSFISTAIIGFPLVLLGLASILKVVGLLISSAAILSKSFDFIKGIGSALGFSSVATGATGLAGAAETLSTLGGPLAIVIGLIAAFATNFGNLRTSIVTGVSEMVAGFEKLSNAIANSIEKNQGLGKLINGVITLFEVLVAVVQSAVVIIGTTIEALLGGFGGVLGLIGDIIDAFSADSLTGVFTQLTSAIKVFLANETVSFLKFVYDLYIGIAQAGVRIVKNIPGAEGFADQLTTNIAGLETYRDSLDNITFAVDKQTGAVIKQDKALEDTANTHKKLAQTSQDLATRLRQLTFEFDEITSKALQSETAINKLQGAFLQTATSLNISGIGLLGETRETTDLDKIKELIGTDVNAALSAIQPAIDKLQTEAVKNITATSKEELRNIVNDTSSAFAEINRLISNQTDPVAKLVRDIFPSLLQVLPDVQTKLQDINNKAARGIEITIADVTGLQDVTANAVKTLNSLQIATGIPIQDAQKAREVADAALKSVVDISSKISTITQKQSTNIVAQTDALNKQAKTLFDIAIARKAALDAEERLVVPKQELETLQAQLTTLEHIQDTQGFTADGLEKINQLQESIRLKEQEISVIENTSNDELKAKQITLSANLKNLQAQNLELQKFRQTVDGITKAFATARDSIVDILREFKSVREEFQTGIGSIFGGASTADLSSRANSIEAQQLKQRFLELRESLPSAGIPAVGDIGKNNLTLLQSAVASLNDFNGNFEFTIDKFIKLVADMSTDVNAQLDSVNLLVKNAEAQGAPPEVVKALRDQQAQIIERANNLVKVTEYTNSLLKTRSTLLKEEVDRVTLIARTEQARLNIIQQQLQLQDELVQAQLANAKERQTAPGIASVFQRLDPRAADDASRAALKIEIELIRNRIDLRRQELEIQRQTAIVQATANGATQDQLRQINALYDAQISTLNNLGKVQVENAEFKSAAEAASEFRQELESILDISENGLLDNLAANLKIFADNIGNWVDVMATSAQLLRDVVQTAFVGALQAIADSFIAFLEGSDDALKSLGAFFGTILVSIGEQIIQMATAAIAMAAIQGFINGLPGGVFAAFGAAAAAALATTAYMAPIIAIGAGLILAGSALGGTGKHTVNSTTKASAKSGANKATGASGDDNFDPSKDIRTIYQKALMAQITIDVRTDDAAIVKTIIKHVNQNGRLTTLIGNRSLQFGY
jgi:hypothetical protein